MGHTAYRVRASFLPGRDRTVKNQLNDLALDEISLDHGAVFERGCVYVVELQESLALPESVSGVANPKSSTGRLDVFTRLITDNCEIFDAVAAGYRGPLYAEISPRTFSIRARKGSRLNQLRFRRRNPAQVDYADFRLSDRKLKKIHTHTPLIDGEPTIRHGLHLRVNLRPIGKSRLIGHRAQRYTGIIDMDEAGKCRISDYWDKITARHDGRLILDPHEFYILASKEALHIPPNLAAEMVPIDTMMGEFRVHYAGFFRSGLWPRPSGAAGVRARCLRSAATRCPSSWKTDRSSGGWPTSASPSPPTSSMARYRVPVIRPRASNSRSIFSKLRTHRLRTFCAIHFGSDQAERRHDLGRAVI